MNYCSLPALWAHRFLASKLFSFLYDKYENYILMSNLFSIQFKSRLTLARHWSMVPAKQIKRLGFLILAAELESM